MLFRSLWLKTWTEIDNIRLRRLREKTSQFMIEVVHVPGVLNKAADALSRLTIDHQDGPDDMVLHGFEDGVFGEYVYKFDMVFSTFMAITELAKAGEEDSQYRDLMKCIEQGFVPDFYAPDHLAKVLCKQLGELSVMNGLIMKDDKVLVPMSMRQKVIELSHMAHPGEFRNVKHLNNHFFWPAMSAELKHHLESCEECLLHKASQPDGRMKMYEPEEQDGYFGPWSHLGLDIFTHDGFDYLIMADRYSGYAIVARMNGLTSRAIWNALWTQFMAYGLPCSMRTDGGRYFVSQEFRDLCTQFDIRLEVSSSYNPQSNGLAESGVKSMKTLLKKTSGWDEFQKSWMEWTNTPRADGTIPSILFFGRFKRGFLPIPVKKYEMVSHKEIEAMAHAKKKALNKQLEYRNRTLRDLAPLEVGDPVVVQDEKTKLWSKKAVVKEVRPSGSYVVKDEHGKTFTRARKFLRLDIDIPSENKGNLQADVSLEGEEDKFVTKPLPVSLRRSPRIIAQHQNSVVFAKLREEAEFDEEWEAHAPLKIVKRPAPRCTA